MRRLRTILFSILAVFCCQTTMAQDVVDSLAQKALDDVELIIDTKAAKKPGDQVKDAINYLVELIKSSGPDPDKSAFADQTAEAYLKVMGDSITLLDVEIAKAKSALPAVEALQLKVDTLNKVSQERSEKVEAYEKLYLKLVNDFLKSDYSAEGLEEAKRNVDIVVKNEARNNFKNLVENYRAWLEDIAAICADAQADCSNPNYKMAWKNPNQSRAYIFTNRLENCAYNNRADKSWKIPYFESVIVNAKSRILMYRDKQPRAMSFDGILPDEFLPKKKEVRVETISAGEETPAPQVNSSNILPETPINKLQ